jgi:hypothetical protein
LAQQLMWIDYRNPPLANHKPIAECCHQQRQCK